MLDNKQNILTTALTLFALRGYESVGVQKIVDESKITKPTLYYYFGNKKGLLDAILQQYFEIFFKSLQNSINTENTLISNLNSIAKVFFNFAKGNKLFYRFQLALFFSPPESETHKSVLLHNSIIFELITSIFEREFKESGNKKVYSKYAFTFIGMLNNYISLYLGDLLLLDEKAEKDVVNQFLYGITEK